MFNKKRLFIFIAFIILLFFMMTFASQPGGVRRVNTREVKFIDGYTKQVISTQTIEVGKDAEVPESPVHDNCKFSGWYTENDVRIDDFTNITTNLTVYSGCAVNYYTVRFYDTIARRVIDTQTVRGGEDASAPTAPTHEGYTFVRWSGKYTNVSADVRVDAIYNANAAAYKVEYYTVKDDVATLYTTKNLTGTVNSNAKAEIITIEGYTYDETNTQNVLSGAIASDGSLVLKVYYAVSNYTVTIDPNCTGDKCDDIKEEEHEYGDEITLRGLERAYTLSYKEADEIEKPNQPQTAVAEFQGYCENATTCENVLTEGTVVQVKDNVTYYAQWNETPLTVDVAEGHNYQTTTTDFTFLYWLDGSKQVEANSKITLTGDKELVAKYDNGTARKYTLTINYVYEDGSEAATTYTDEVANGTTYNVTSPDANKAGYHAQEATVTGTMPAEALTLSVTYVANTDMPYTVEHYKQNVDGTYPDTASETENKTDGVTDQTVTATPKEYTGFTQDTENQLNHLTDTIDGTSNIVLKVYYKRDVHTVTVTYHYANNEHPDTVVGPDSYRYEQSYSYTTPEVAGYSADKSTVSGSMGTEDVTETVTYTASTTMPYTVEHYKQNVDGSYPTTASETESKTDGVTDQTVTATPKEYTGFTQDTENQLNHLTDTIDGTSNIVLKVYYKRDVHTVTVTYKYANNEHDDNVVGPDSYRYEESYSYTTPEVAGYTASQATVSGNMGLEDVTVTVTYTASTTMPYTVEHYKQNVDGSYPTEPTTTDSKTDGVTDQTVTATPNEYTGFTQDTENQLNHLTDTIDGTSNIVLKVYYKRDVHTVTVTYKYANNEHDDNVVGPDSYRYEQPYSYTTPEVAGYSASQATVSGNMGTEDVTVTVTYTASSTIAYKVEHYKQNVDGSYPTTATSTDNMTNGVTDQYVTATPNEYTGFTYDADNTSNYLRGKVTADGNLTLKVYYKRDTHNVTITYQYANNEHPAVTVGPDSYRYEQSYSYTTPEVAGYSANKTTVSGTMGLEDVTETVTYTASTTMPYTVEHYKQNLDGSYPTEPTETENKTDGVTDQTVTAVAKDYEGFTVDETVEGTHKSEVLTAGSNVVLKLFYKRDTYTITIDPQCEDPNNTSCTTITEDHPYGDTITLNELSRSYTLTFSENSAVNPQVGSIDAAAEFQGYCLNSTDATTCTKVQAGTVTVTGTATYNAIWNEAGLHVEIPTGGNYTTETEIGEFASWKDTSNTIVNPTNDYFVTKSDTLTANYTNKYTLTITYKYTDGTEAAPTHTEVLVKGSTYSVTSPTITGHTASQGTVSGTITANVTTEVEYSKKSLSYTVNFYYDDVLNSSITDQKADYGTEISYSDYTVPENMKVDMEKTNPTSITIGEDVSANVLNIYYKTTSVELSVTTNVSAPRDPAEYGDQITITVTIKNVGDGTGKVTVKDSELAKALNPTSGNPLISIVSSGVTVDGEASTTYNALDILGSNGIVINDFAPDQTMVVTLVVSVKANAGDKINSKVESKVNDGNFTTESTNTITVEKTLNFNKLTEQVVGTNVVIALDASGSMLDKVNGKTLLKYAQQATETFIKNVFPNSDIDATHTNVVVLKYGSTGSDCHYSLIYGRYCDVNTPFAEQVGTTLTSYANRQALINSVNNITITEPSGTPYYIALEEVYKVLYTENTGLAATNPNNKNVVVFLTDGAPDRLDNADRRAAAIASLHADGKETIVYAVALGDGASEATDILTAIAGDSSRVITTGAAGLEEEFRKISVEAAPDPRPTVTEEGVAEIGTDLRVDETHKLTIIVNKNTSSERTIEYTSISAAMNSGYLIQENGEYDIDATKFNPSDTIYVSFYGNTGRSLQNRAATKRFSSLYGPLYEGLVEGQVLPEIDNTDETNTTDEVVNSDEVTENNTTPIENTEVTESTQNETTEETTESEEVVNETTPSETEATEETNNDNVINEESTGEAEELPKEILPVGEVVSVEEIVSTEVKEAKPEIKEEEEIPATKEEISTEVVQEEK